MVMRSGSLITEIKVVTPPMPVPSQDEKGGGGGVTTSLKNLGSSGPDDSTQ